MNRQMKSLKIGYYERDGGYLLKSARTSRVQQIPASIRI